LFFQFVVGGTSTLMEIPDKGASGDEFYGAFIDQPQIDYFWKYFHFQDKPNNWVNGAGWEDPSNADLPLGRTFNGCYLLTYSAFDYENDSYSRPILNWARRMVHDQINDLRAAPGDLSKWANTTTGGSGVDDRVELYMPFFYSATVVERAACLLHEARHWHDKPHNAAFPSWSALAGAKPQADSDWGYNGAWAYEVNYLSEFVANGVDTTLAMREQARQRANWVLDNAFATHPGFNVGPVRGNVPAAVSWAPERLDLFIVGASGAAYHKAWDGGPHWLPSTEGHDWEFQGGNLRGAPVAVAWGPNRLDLFGVGRNKSVYHKWWDGIAWRPDPANPGAWQHKGGKVSGLTAVSWGPDRLDLFGSGIDGAIYHKAWAGGPSWWPSDNPDDWHKLGGVTRDVPVAVSWAPNRLDLFVVGGDNAVYHKWWAGGPSWGPSDNPNDWHKLGGTTKERPAVVSWGKDRLDIFVTGLDGAIYHKAWDGGPSWWPSDDPNDWHKLGGSAAGSPAAVSWAKDRLDLFVRGGDGAVYHKAWDGGPSWLPSDDPSDWDALGGKIVGDICAVSWGKNRFDLFVVSPGGAVFHKAWDQDHWYPSPSDWEPMGGTVG
jgi:hypothetical protein